MASVASEAEPEAEGARAVGRGGIAVLGAKIYFVLIGLVVQTLLPRAIGLAGYGALARVLAIANVVNNVVVSSSTQGVSRTIASARDTTQGEAGDARGRGREEAFRVTLRVHVPIAFALAALFALVAPALARFQSAPHITRPLQIIAGVVAAYGCYAPLVGYLNGRAMFTRQAALDALFATLRTVGLLGAGAFFFTHWGSGVEGAVLGFVLAAVAIVPFALRSTGIGRAPSSGVAPSPGAPRVGAYLALLGPLALAQLFTNAVMQSDITLLGRFLSLASHGAGLPAADAAKAADEWVAVYRACQLFAFLPYQLLLSVTQILFPMVAKAESEGDRPAVRLYVERGARIGAIACGLLVAIVAALPGSVLGFAYGPVVAERGAATLRVLAIGQGAFAMFAIVATVLASLGRERIAAFLSLITLLVVGAACYVGASDAPFGDPQLRATALATSVALGLGLVAAAIVVKKYAGGFLPIGTILRVSLGLAAAVAMGMSLPPYSKLATPLAAAGIATLYLVVLVISRELTGADVAMVRLLFARKRG